MARKKKCAFCGQDIEINENTIPVKNQVMHDFCFNASLKAIKKGKDEKLAQKTKESKSKRKQAKPPAELKDAVSEEDYAEKKQYYQYLRSLIDDELSAKVYALSDQYVSRYNFTFKEMYQTLVYLHEIVEKELVGEVVGLIPYYFTEAQNYFKSIEQVEEINKDIDISKMYKEKIIRIQPKKRVVKQLNIENIGKGEENGS